MHLNEYLCYIFFENEASYNNNNNIQMFIQGVHRAINGLTGVPVVKKS